METRSDLMVMGISDITGIPKILSFDQTLRLLRKCTLANGYGLYYDLLGNRYYIAPEAEKYSKEEWIGTLVDGDYYIYLRGPEDTYGKEELEIVNERDEWFKE